MKLQHPHIYTSLLSSLLVLTDMIPLIHHHQRLSLVHKNKLKKDLTFSIKLVSTHIISSKKSIFLILLEPQELFDRAWLAWLLISIKKMRSRMRKAEECVFPRRNLFSPSAIFVLVSHPLLPRIDVYHSSSISSLFLWIIHLWQYTRVVSSPDIHAGTMSFIEWQLYRFTYTLRRE